MSIQTIAEICHPIYAECESDWRKWRITFKGGRPFIDTYLVRFDKAEDDADFCKRKDLTPSPSFAKANLMEVRNSIYQRFSDIVREGGSQSYQEAVKGLNGGVDLEGSSMSTFIGTEVLEDLLVVAKVGVYVDMPPKVGLTVIENQDIRPYTYVYRTEDIRSWEDDEGPTQNQYKVILLRDHIYTYDENTHLPNGTACEYRLYWKKPNGKVGVKFFDHKGDPKVDQEFELDIPRIPIVIRELKTSLLEDAADYQIALLNLNSSDISFCFRANFPLYTEQYNQTAQLLHAKQTLDVDTDGGIKAPAAPAQSQKVEMGTGAGRLYGPGCERPAFISPSSEPLKASMEKQEQMKIDMRLLINLAITNIQPKMASADSKGMDARSLESGLSYIGLILEDMEREIAYLWHLYENQINNLPTINYPKKYSLKTTAEIQAEIDALEKSIQETPSITARKIMMKRIIELKIAYRSTTKQLDDINNEIDASDVIGCSQANVVADVQAGILDKYLAAEIRYYPKSTVDKANEQHIERLKEIQMAQTPGAGAGAAASNDLKNPGSRGVADKSANPKQDALGEKQGKPQRGPGK